MKNKKIVITGAGSGLGRSLAQQASKKGAKVYLLGRTKEKLEQVAETLDNPVGIHTLDVRKTDEVDQVFSEVGPIDILVNNAGVGSFAQAEELSEIEIDKMIDTNLKGTIFCSQAALPKMKEEDKGLIVNIISTAGKRGKATESVYCASKFGVRGFTESLAVELEDTPLKVVGVYMGGMRTNFWEGIFDEEKLKQLMDPDDIAEIILSNIKSRPNLNVEEIVIENKK
ncbi:SDR family oxidoreductase [Halanaerocella petrolearia]